MKQFTNKICVVGSTVLLEKFVLLERPENNKAAARSLLLFEILKVKSIQASLTGRIGQKRSLMTI